MLVNVKLSDLNPVATIKTFPCDKKNQVFKKYSIFVEITNDMVDDQLSYRILF